MLNDNRFFNHKDEHTFINAKECRALEVWMNKRNSSNQSKNNWQVLTSIWNDIPNVVTKVDLNDQPNYSTIKPYK